MDLRPLLVVLLFSTSMLAGCFGEDAAEVAPQASDDVYPEPWARADLEYNDLDIYARVSVNGSTASTSFVRSTYRPDHHGC